MIGGKRWRWYIRVYLFGEEGAVCTVCVCTRVMGGKIDTVTYRDIIFDDILYRFDIAILFLR